jgi:virulence factor Mce-like protein
MNARRLVPYVLGGAVIVLAVVLLTGGGDGYTVKAEFKDLGGLRKNSSVKIAGVPAGKVTNLEVTDRDTAIATFKLRDNAAPIGRGASVKVRPTDLLGERYAEVDPGDRDKPVPSGSLIPKSATSTSVELDDILNMIDADTRTRLGIMINELGVAFAGRGADFNKLLASLPPSLEDTQKLIDEVDTENVAMKSAIVKGDRILAPISDKRHDMGLLVDQAASALTTVADKRQELGATIANAPGALRELRTTLRHLDSASVELKPAARDLQRTAGPLRSTLEALPEFAHQAAPTLETAKAVAPSLTRLGLRATPTIRRLNLTAKQLKNTLEPADPALQHMTNRGTDDLLYFVNNMSRALRGRDGVSHMIGAHFYVDLEPITSAINLLNGSTPTAKKKTAKQPAKVDLAPVTKPVKDLTDKVKGTTDKVKKLLPPVAGKAIDGVQKTVDGLLTKVGNVLNGGKQDERNKDSDALGLLDYLMGP